MKDYSVRPPVSYSSLNEKPQDSFLILLRAHDHIFFDKGFTFQERLDACELLWTLALKDACGSALTVESFPEFHKKADALYARVKLLQPESI